VTADATPGFLIFLGAIGLLAWWLWCSQQRAALAMPPHPADADGYWQTPFYLRSNTPVYDGTQAIMPSVVSDAWALATYYSG
jgi:hypothetical protein